MDAGRQTRFVQRQRRIEVEIPPKRFGVVDVVEEVQAHQHIRLLDVPRTQDAIPRPVHIDRALLRRDVGRGAQILVQKGVMLRENAQTAVVRIIHAVGNVLHVLEIIRRNLQGFQAVVIQLGACLHKILQAPRRHAVGVPVVVDVVLVLIRAGHAEIMYFCVR